MTAPHVQIEQAALYAGARIHDRVHTVVTAVADRDVEHGADRKDRWIRGGDAAAHADARRRRRAFAIRGGAEG